MTSILQRIVTTKLEQIEATRAALPLAELRAAVPDAPPVRDFLSALTAQQGVALIAEVKKASPSRGVIRESFDPVEIASTYQRHGASCISVLTDTDFFRGSLDHLRAIRAAVETPLLRKDFILDSYQLWEARAAGADAVLLIAECLDQAQLRQLHEEAVSLSMTALVELYDAGNLDRVLDAGARLIGVNNRDLNTFHTDLNHAIGLRSRIPADRVMVAESGIRGPDDVRRLEEAGIDAMLVGEHLMAARDVGRAVDELLGNL